MNKRNLTSAIEDALTFEVYDDGDTEQVVDMIFDGVVKVLRRDARFPRLMRTDYDLLFADLIKEASETLLPYQIIDNEHAAEIIAEALIDETEDDDHERRENSEADQAAVVAK
jgi:hypothetical protein